MGPGLLSGSNNLNINGGSFTQVNGDFIKYHVKGDLYNHETEMGLLALSVAISADALHDASERFPPPRCHPATRTRVLELIMAWLKKVDSNNDILWLYGPAGAGKSAIAQSIAELCRSSGNHLAGSFFFLRGKAGRDTGRHLFCTLAYQLALHVPGLRVQVNRAMLVDPTIPSKSMDAQLKALIIEPMRKIGPLPYTPLVIIDGLDECDGLDEQIRITNLVAQANLPLHFLIASRPEPHIHNAFDSPLLSARTKRILLDNTFNPDKDIRRFLVDGFADIRGRHPELMSYVAKPWPPISIIDFLLQKSSGQFIYAATVLKFVGAESFHPIRQLDIVLQPPPTTSSAFSNLDQLYMQILLKCPYPDILVQILSLFVVFHCPQPPEVYEDLLGLAPGEVGFMMRGMHSLVKFPNAPEDEKEKLNLLRYRSYDHTRGLRSHHASFRDFLLDVSRSTQFCVDLGASHNRVVQKAIELFTKCIEYPWRSATIPHLPRRETWGYLKHHFNIHLSYCQREEQELTSRRLVELDLLAPSNIHSDDLAWDVSFDALHALLTALARIVGPAEISDKLGEDHSHWAYDTPLIHMNISQNYDLFGLVASKYRDFLDTCYRQALSSIVNDDFIWVHCPSLLGQRKRDRHPGILHYQLEFMVTNILNSLPSILHLNRRFVNVWDSIETWDDWDKSNIAEVRVSLNSHFKSFLTAPHRAGLRFYCDPLCQPFNACSHLIILFTSEKWLRQYKHPVAISFLEGNFYSCLADVNIEIYKGVQQDHPLLHCLCTLAEIKYDIDLLTQAPMVNIRLLWAATTALLDWVKRQVVMMAGRVAVNTTTGQILGDVLTNISTNIYHQILCLETTSNNTQAISLIEPLSRAATPHFHSELSLYPLNQDLTYADPTGIGVSRNLLSLHALHDSLRDFLTRPTLSGELYISSQTYHTQFAEICLEICSVDQDSFDWKTQAAHTVWRYHLTRAYPSRNILRILRTIPYGRWLHEGNPIRRGPKTEVTQDVLQWLNKISRRPEDIYQRWSSAPLSRSPIGKNRSSINPIES